ncbi:hypothetical protein GUJ93_ZPchr0012g19288 [Zizania palustris]|uniref:Uncharacterized protein n=1 Tax=Zizania palustris TaxID=103762 RepID=A0A8J5WSA6_ZIZPA|nr:hypothetical protein GUJ93_ZPchr0012g19288 [Zizania palustris]
MCGKEWRQSDLDSVIIMPMKAEARWASEAKGKPKLFHRGVKRPRASNPSGHSFLLASRRHSLPRAATSPSLFLAARGGGAQGWAGVVLPSVVAMPRVRGAGLSGWAAPARSSELRRFRGAAARGGAAVRLDGGGAAEAAGCRRGRRGDAEGRGGGRTRQSDGALESGGHTACSGGDRSAERQAKFGNFWTSGGSCFVFSKITSDRGFSIYVSRDFLECAQ